MRREGLRVVHVIDTLRRGGAERLVVHVCNRLARLDVPVAVYHLGPPASLAGEFDDRVVVRSGAAVIDLSRWRPDRIETPVFAALLEEFRPTVVHSHLPWSDLVALHHHRPGRIHVSHLHNSWIPELAQGPLLPRSRAALGRAYERRRLMAGYGAAGTRFLACSPGALQFYRRHVKLDGHRVLMLPNAVPRPEAVPEPPGAGPPRLVSVGTLEDRKNHVLLVEVVRRLRDDLGMEAELTLLGEGPTRPRIEAAVAEAGLDASVRLVGEVASATPYLADAHLYVHAALPGTEGMPMVFLEAFASGRPVVTTPCMPGQGLVENGVNGLVVPMDPAGYARGVHDLVRSPDRYAALRDGALRTVRDFSIESYVDRLLDYYAS